MTAELRADRQPARFICAGFEFGLRKSRTKREAAMPKRYQATSTNVEDYWQLFVNRRAYVLQSMRTHAESGRYYYCRPKAGKNGEVPSLTAATVRRHLEGDLTIGVYAMSPGTQRCKWIAMDGDYKDSLKHLCELQWELQQQKVEAALEQSRRGAHLWIFVEPR